MFRPIGRCTRAICVVGDAELAQRREVRALVPGVAHDADPAGAGRPARRLQHRAELGPVVVGQHDVGVLVEARPRPGRCHLACRPCGSRRCRQPVVGSGSTSIGLEAELDGEAQHEVVGDRRGEDHGDEAATSSRSAASIAASGGAGGIVVGGHVCDSASSTCGEHLQARAARGVAAGGARADGRHHQRRVPPALPRAGRRRSTSAR